MTADEFYRMPDPSNGSKQELVKGVVISFPIAGLEHGRIQGNASALINLFVRPLKLGRVAIGSGVVSERNPDSVRGPDVSFYSKERLPPGLQVVGYHDRPPDLCVEVLSPCDTKIEIARKTGEYFTAGVRTVWIIDPEDRSISLFPRVNQVQVIQEPGELSGGDVLPGFSCRVSELFDE